MRILILIVAILFNTAIDRPSLETLIQSFPQLKDYERPVRLPIPRSEAIVKTIAEASLETEDPIRFAIWLDVLGAHESGYKLSLVGDHGQSCGAFQTSCARTPGFVRCSEDEPGCHYGWTFRSAPGVALAQCRLAIHELQRWIDAKCMHPIWGYARGECSLTNTARLYEIDVDAEQTIAASTWAARP